VQSSSRWRPTLGSTSRDGIVPLFLSRDTGGPLARTVTDAAAVLDAVAGTDPADAATAAAQGLRPATYLSKLDKDGLKGARIGVLRQFLAGGDPDPEVVALFEQALADMKRRGADIVDGVSVPDIPTSRLGCDRFKHDINAYLAHLGPQAPVKSLAEIIASRKFYPPGCTVGITTLAGLRLRTMRKLPAGPDEVTGIAVRIPLQIILMLRLGLPERTDGRHFRHDLAWPKAGGLDIRYRIFRDALLLVVQVENGGTVARADIVALTVARGGIVNLKEKFEQGSIADDLGIENDLDGLGMGAVVAVGRVGDVAAAIADAG
jgi:hypothetical protein